MGVKKSLIFEKAFLKMLSEDVTTSVAHVGDTNPTQFSGDTYAPGDARMPKVLGARRVKGKKKTKLPIQRRSGVIYGEL